MTISTTPVSVFFGPLLPDWTITGLLEWIGAEDARCRDDRLAPVLDAVGRALGAQPLERGRGRGVAGVRLLASRVAADPAVGERTLGVAVAVAVAAAAAGGGAAAVTDGGESVPASAAADVSLHALLVGATPG